jgi:TPR repeat protein
MYRLGIAELNGELGLSKSPKEGVNWLKRSAEHATAEFPHALHELALLHERGIDNVLFVDYEYSTELLAQAAELGYAASAYRLGECYEYGKNGCPQDPALSIHYYVSLIAEWSITTLNVHSEHRCATRPPGCLLRSDGLVSGWITGCPPAI